MDAVYLLIGLFFFVLPIVIVELGFARVKP